MENVKMTIRYLRVGEGSGREGQESCWDLGSTLSALSLGDREHHQTCGH